MQELSTEIVQRAFAGDAGAVRQLIALITPVIRARVGAALRPRRSARTRDVHQEVEDLTQQVLLLIFANDARALRQWDPARGLSLAGFVGLLAEHEVSSIFRSRRRSPWAEEPAENEALDRSTESGRGPERVLASRELLKLIFDRVDDRLTQRGREMFLWLMVDERPVEEVCRLSGLTAGAVYVWRNRLTTIVRQVAENVRLEAALQGAASARGRLFTPHALSCSAPRS